MNKIMIALLIALLTFGVIAQENRVPSYLCLAEAATGFKLDKNGWVQENFLLKKYMLKKQGSLWNWKEFGGDLNVICQPDEDFNDDELNCTEAETNSHIAFNRATQRFGYSQMIIELSEEGSSVFERLRLSNVSITSISLGKCEEV